MNDMTEDRTVRCSSVLVVEDDPALRLIMTKQLEHLGLKVDCAANGIEAVRQCEDNQYCLVFMDIQMPQMNGLQATSSIRAYEETSQTKPTPIIATTSGGASREVCLAVGMTDYVEKPVNMDKLENILGKWKCLEGCNI